MGVSHVYTSPIADGTNTQLVRPSDWNSAHTYNISHSELGGTGSHLAIGNSETTYTSGTVSLSALTNITIRSTTGNAFQFSVAAQSTQVETQTFLGALKNTETTYTSGTVELEGTNNITVFSTTGQRFRISGANTHAQQTGISGISNSETTYTSGTVGLSVVGGALTIRSTTGNAFQFSASQSVQAETQTFIGGISNSETNYTSGTVKISALGDMTIRSTTGNAFQFSVRDQTAITATTVSSVSSANAVGANNSRFAMEAHIHEGVRRIGMSTGGNTSGTTGIMPGSNIVLAATGDLTLSQNTDAASNISLTISAPSQTIQTATTVSSVSSANAVGANNSRFAMEAHIHEGVRRMGISTQGNTLGTTGIFPGSNIVFAATGDLTLSQNTDAASNNTITISAPAQTIQTATTVSSVSSANAVGANNSRFAMEAHIHEGVRRFGISTQGHTSGTTGILPGSNIQLVATNGVTLSQGTDAASNNTITIVHPMLSRYIANSAYLVSSSSGNMVNTSVSLMRFELPEVLSFSRVDVPISISLATSATTNTAAVDMSFVAQILTRNASTLSPLVGTSSTNTYTWASNSGAFSSFTGLRVMSLPLATMLTPGEYYFALQMSSHSGSSIGLSTTALSMTFAPIFGTSLSSVGAWADLSAASGITINALQPMAGMNSVSLSNTTMTHQASQITVSGAGISGNIIAAFRNN